MLKFLRKSRKSRQEEGKSEEGIKLTGYKLRGAGVVDREKAFKDRQKEIKRQKRQEKLREFWLDNAGRIFLITFSLFVLVILLLLASVLHQNKTYIISEFEVVGNDRIKKEDVESILEQYIGESMILVSNRDIKNSISGQFVYLEDVTVKKILPGKIYIDINERVPEMVFVNLSGIYLVDSLGMTVNVMHKRDIEGLTEEQAQIVAGMGDSNSEMIRELYLSKIEDPEERQGVVWEEVSLEEKLLILEELRINLERLLEDQLSMGIEKVEESAFSELLRVYSFESTEYSEGDFISNLYYLDYPVKLNKYFDRFEDLASDRYLWQSKFLLRVDLSNEKFLLFSSQDSIDWQIRKLGAVQDNGLLSEGRLFDLRGEKIVVR